MKNNKDLALAIILVLGVLFYGLFTSYEALSFSQGPNNRNVTIDTRLNVTDSLPEVLQVLIEDGASNVTLTAGTNTTLNCSAIIRDYNGGTTITNVSARFWHNSTSNDPDADDNNYHYTDGSCILGNTGSFLRNVSCLFNVTYFANSGSWICNVTAWDDYDFSTAYRYGENNNNTNLDGLLALNVTPLIDYGKLAVGDTSDSQQANVTNLGNVDMDVSVEGYGAERFDGLSFNCTVGNISVEYELYNITDYGQDTTRYINLSSSLTSIPNFGVRQNTNDTGSSLNATFWVVYVPPNPFGICNGSIIFQAEAYT